MAELARLLGKAEELLKLLLETRAKLKAAGIVGADFSRGIDEHVAVWLMREFAAEFERGEQSGREQLAAATERAERAEEERDAAKLENLLLRETVSRLSDESQTRTYTSTGAVLLADSEGAGKGGEGG